jgi:branched-chain amino acid transport system substrate-binding protein
MINGAQIAADEINAAGGVNGKKIEIVAIDDAADPDTGVAAAEAAIAEGLDGVVGPYNSGVGIKTLPLYQAAGVLPIRLTSNSKTNAMGFTLQPMDYQIAPVAATGLEKWLGAKSVAIIYDDSAEYTKSIATTLKSQLEADGLTVPVFTAITPGEADYSAAVMSASQAGVDVIYGATYFPEGSLLAQAIHTLQVAQPCVLDYGSYDPGYIANAGSVEVAMACTLVGVPSPTDFVKGAGFVADYTEMFGEAPGTWSPYTYDSVKLLADAMTSTKGSDVAALTDYLNKVVDWQGATGSVTIDPANGNREPATVVFLSVTPAGEFHVSHDWATAVGAPF